MTDTLSVAVMAHPRRYDLVDDLLDRLDRPVEVVWDKINDRHDTGIRAIEAHDPACTHHLVIQDDVMPCRDLIAGAEKALGHVPAGNPASFYLGRVQPFRRKVQEAVDLAGDSASWVTMQGVYWGPAIVVPTAVIEDLSRWFRSPAAARVTNYDRRVSKWFEARRLDCWYSWPSLVDHRGAQSLVRESKALRTAHRFVGADRSALDVDWSGPVTTVTGSARLDRQRQRTAPTPYVEAR